MPETYPEIDDRSKISGRNAIIYKNEQKKNTHYSETKIHFLATIRI